MDVLSQFVKSYGPLPSTYAVIDTESTGFDKNADLLWSFGICLVVDDKIAKKAEVILDWTRPETKIDHFWLSNRIRNQHESMGRKGAISQLSFEALRKGVEPLVGLRSFLELLVEARNAGAQFVGHNVIRFDVPWIVNQFDRYLGPNKWLFRKQEILDTAAIEKAIQLPLYPAKGQSRFEFQTKSVNMFVGGKKIRHALVNHCAEKYGLMKKANISLSETHGALADCLLCHELVQSYKELLNRVANVAK